MSPRSIYVERRLKAGVDEVWRLTQEPAEHARWDLRFTTIEYLPRASPGHPQRFLYTTRIGFGLAIRGEGESVVSREGPQGVRTSSLKFWSDMPISLIREGSGYWKYVPVPDGLRFLTRYDYRVRFGALGRFLDSLVFRPLLGWATAWSFDRLHLWIERGIPPEVSRERSIVQATARLATAAVWIYQGVVPKWIRPAAEVAILQQSGMFSGRAGAIVHGVGAAEILFGLAFLALWRLRLLFAVNALILALLLAGAIPSGGPLLAAPFNPVSLTIALWALSLVGWIAQRDLPTAAKCLRREPHA